jgi:hypothetical protein
LLAACTNIIELQEIGRKGLRTDPNVEDVRFLPRKA